MSDGKNMDCGSITPAILAWIPQLEGRLQELRWHAAEAEREGDIPLRDELMAAARMNEGRIRTLHGALKAMESGSVADQIREAIASLDDDPRRKGTRPPRIPWSVQLAGLLTKLEGIAGHTEQESKDRGCEP